MSAGGFDALPWVAALAVVAVGLGVARQWLRRRATPLDGRGPAWRAWTLSGLQVVAGLALVLTLFPPSVVLRSGTLVVATEGAPMIVETAPGEILVALPEAPAIAEAERAPDLAAALAAHPQVARIRVIGSGLSPRDQSPPGLPVVFDPPPLPSGLIELATPPPVAPGGAVSVAGRVGSLAAGTVELVDPAGAVVDQASITAGRRFALRGTARAAGLVLFSLRLRDSAGNTVETVAVPVEVREQPLPRVLVLSGSAGPETKYLRRWAEDAGIDLTVQIDLGAGVQLAEAPVTLTAAALSEIDLLVVDDRRWDALSPAQRAAVTGPVEAGMGLLLRPTGPVSASTRRSWAGLGVATSGGAETAPLILDPPPAPGATEDDEPAPELTRRDLQHEGPGAVSFLRDADGVALASWRARGAGRVGLWTVADSYALVLAGRSDRYGDLWSGLVSALARPVDETRPELIGLARPGLRATLCGLEGDPRVLGPDDRLRSLAVDPDAGPERCAAWWPETTGWHLIRDGEGRDSPVYVHAAEAAPSLRLAANRAATQALTEVEPASARSGAAPRGPGSPWPWFALLLVALGGSWWLERNGGRRVET